MTPEIKAAWRKLRSYQEKDLIDPNEAILMDAFIDAEARARKCEAWSVHPMTCRGCEVCNMTNESWREAVIAELTSASEKNDDRS